MNQVMITACASLAFGTSALAQTFQGLGIPTGGTQSYAAAISADGTTVVGRSESVPNQQVAWKWRASTGLMNLPDIPGYTFAQRAVGVSADGAVVLGNIGAGVEPSQVASVLWRDGQPSTVISEIFQPLGISGDGSTVVGRIDGAPSDNPARRWTQATGAQGIGPLPPGPYSVGWSNNLGAATADGSVLVGSASVVPLTPPSTAYGTPMIWTAATGPLAVLHNGVAIPGGFTDITPDGTVMVGSATINGISQLFRYTSTGGYQFINPNGNTISFPMRTSDDGNTIISRLTYWTPQSGAISLQQALTLSGCNFAGWTLQEVIDISGDGRTLVGNGLNPQGVQEAWIATIPTPGVMLPLVMVGLFAGRRRR